MQVGAVNDVVYHYTSIDTLMKIVESRAVWATSVNYLNDQSEFRFFFEQAAKCFDIFSNTHQDLKHFEPLAFSSAADSDFRRFPFVASFTGQDDSLMHWRSYCQQGAGVSIGFRSKCLTGAGLPRLSAPGITTLDPVFGKVLYLDRNNLAKVLEILEDLYAQTARFMSDHSRLGRMDISLPELFGTFTSLRAGFAKSGGFEHESEHRLLVEGIHLRQDALRFRTVRSSLVPYVILDVPDTQGEVDPAKRWDAISTVTVGPTPNMKLTCDALKAFFETRQHLAPIKVRASEINYREW